MVNFVEIYIDLFAVWDPVPDGKRLPFGRHPWLFVGVANILNSSARAKGDVRSIIYVTTEAERSTTPKPKQSYFKISSACLSGVC
jgi:hypothetical protein